MNRFEIMKALLDWPMWIGLSALFICILAWLVCAISGKRRSCRFRRRFSQCGNGRSAASQKLDWPALLGIVALASVCTVLAGRKHMLQIPSAPPPVVQIVTPDEIAQGWRLESVTTNDAVSYAMPEGVSPTFNWHKRGTFGEWSRLDLGDFAFPIGTNGEAVTSFSVFSDGRIRPRPRDVGREICAVGVPMLAMQGASRFWAAEEAACTRDACPCRVKSLTWENFFLHADTNAPVNAQIRLFENGDFVTRSNDVERVYRRVEPFDWDGDGLENTVDPEPLVAGPDAHGTNAEWYNVVCSNIVNSNAYYFVDVVAERGPAPIYFTGDRASRLGSPVVVAHGGETNHVPLLIGINYAVTSSVPISVALPTNSAPPGAGVCYAAVTTNGASSYAVQWPLEFTVSPDGTGSRISAAPYDPGCAFQWTEPTRSVACSYTTDGGWIGFNCCGIGVCGCRGCSVSGVATLEDASFDLPNVWCGCWRYDPLDPEIGIVFTNVPCVSVSFDKAVVFYEDAYTNSPNDVAAKHSTDATLTVFAYGGDVGGMLYVSEQKIGKLVRVGGKAISFPHAAFVPPQGGVSFSIEYEADTHSDSEGDIAVEASLIPGDGGGIVSDSASATAVKIEVKSVMPDSIYNNVRRHRYGIGEIVTCSHKPQDLTLTWEQTGHGQLQRDSNALTYFTCPLYNETCALIARHSHSEFYQLDILLVEPTSFHCERASPINFNLGSNVAGGAGMALELYIEPRTVCFGNIALEEVPTEEGAVGGYFDNEEFVPYWAHTRERRAGMWENIGNDNLFLLEDEATMGETLPPMTPDGTLTNDVSFGWQDGAIIWNIPLGWNEHGTSGEADPIKTNAVPEQQTFIITTNGTLSVIKAGWYVSRGTNTQIRLERLPQ